MAGALLQMAAPGTRLRALCETDAEPSHSIVDVEPRPADTLTALLTGYAARSMRPDHKQGVPDFPAEPA